MSDHLNQIPPGVALLGRHGGPSANPPAASFYGEREYDSEKIRLDLTQMTILDGPLVAQRRGLPNGRAGLAQRVAQMAA
jgi:hypothetical protein